MTTVPPPVPVTANLTPSKPLLSSFVISTAVERLFGYVNGTVTVDNDTEFGKYCSSLARGIDFSIDINEIPQRAQELPNLMKQLCRWTNDMSFRAAIMVLMISIKGACKAGWFSEKDNEELHSLSIEIANNFSSVKDMISGEGTFHQTVSSVISRFYPGMKMGEVLAFIEATPGYGAYVKDFYMTANAKASNEKVYLFVARTDTTETSSCIVSPQQVNIFLNGNPVDRRTYVYKDPGPQLPTLVTNINKSGSNLLQALGQFNGKYVILVAFMSMGSNPRCPELPVYMAPAAATSDSDNDIIEGPSRVSLICPISFKRIITPVKGHLCKHLQCFDFDNYVDINSRRPSWRCPHCSQSVCFTDIRIDQGMVKVLKEVGGNVSHVKVSGDGSWLTFDECDDHANKPQDKPPVPQESPTSLNVDPNIIILAEGDNDMDGNPEQVDKKPTPAQLQAASMNNVRSSIAPPMMAPVTGTGNATSQGQSQNQSQRSASIDTKIPTHAILTSSTAMNTLLHGQNQSQVYASNTLQLPAHAIGTSNTIMNAMSHGQSQIQRQSQMSASNNMQLPTHSVFNAVMDAVSQGPSQTYVSNDMQFQQHNLNTMRNDHCGRYPTSARHISIIPTASTGTVIDDRQQQFYNYHTDQHQTMRMMSSPSQNMGSQNWVHRDNVNVSSQPVQQFSAHSGLHQQSNSYQLNTYQHQSLNQMPLNSLRQPSQLSPQIHQGIVGPTYVQSNQEVYHYVNVRPSTPFSSGSPTVPSPLQTSRSSVTMTSLAGQRVQVLRPLDGSVDAPADQNLRPTGRMRGSITGRVYSDALSQMIILPTEPVQAASQPVLNTPRNALPPHLQVLLASNGNVHGYLDGASGSM